MSSNRKMPDKLDLGNHMASSVLQPLMQYREWIEQGKPDTGFRMAMGYKLPSWQREFVWSEEQSIKLIESLWLGINIGTYTFNRSFKNDEYDDLLIDGQQRMKSVENYINDKFKVFGYLWSETTEVDKRAFKGFHFHCFITEKDDEKYLREYYNLMNFSGTRHNEDEKA